MADTIYTVQITARRDIDPPTALSKRKPYIYATPVKAVISTPCDVLAVIDEDHCRDWDSLGYDIGEAIEAHMKGESHGS